MYPRENSFNRRQVNYPENRPYDVRSKKNVQEGDRSMGAYIDESPIAVRQAGRHNNFSEQDYYSQDQYEVPPNSFNGPREHFSSRNHPRDPRYDMQLQNYDRMPPSRSQFPPQDTRFQQLLPQDPRFDPRYSADPCFAQDPRVPPRNFSSTNMPPPGHPAMSQMYAMPGGYDAEYTPISYRDPSQGRHRWSEDNSKIPVHSSKNTSGPGSGPTTANVTNSPCGRNARGASDNNSTSSNGTKGSSATDKARNAKRKLDPKVFALSMELLDHAGNGRLELCQRKIASGANPDFADYDKRTPLHMSSSNGHLPVVKLLLDCGANPDVEDRWGSKPVDDAMKNDHKEIIELLCHHGGDYEDTLHKEQLDGLELLEYCSKGLIKMVRDKIRAGTKATFSSYDRRTSLHLACCEGHMDVMELLLQNGADANCRDRFGRTPVDDALCNGHVNVLRRLASKGIQVPEHILDEDHTPEFQLNMQLIDVCAKGKVGAVQKCINEGADVQFSDYDKRSPLHLACVEGRTKIVALLLSEGADPTVEDRFGTTTMEEAAKYGHHDILEMIKEHMKSSSKKSG